jgi:presenilin-like A22 family membrane protease
MELSVASLGARGGHPSPPTGWSSRARHLPSERRRRARAGRRQRRRLLVRALWAAAVPELIRRPAESVFATKLSILSLPLGLLSGAIVLSYLYTKHWVLSNILALSLAHSGITLMALDSFRTGGIMLLGLFAYDIFWVFGTDVMVSVARGLDGPIKITFPKNFADGLQRALEGAEPDWKLTMLGLGDIVIPGEACA